MSITVLPDQVEGSSLRVGAGGIEVDRMFLVQGITGPAHAKAYRATSAPGIPAYGDPHPSVPYAFVNAIVPTSKGGGTFYVRVGYASKSSSNDPKKTQITVGTTCQQETIVPLGTNGKPLTVSGPDPDDATKTKVVGGTVSVFLPHSSLTFIRTEPASPGEKSRLYSGKVNSGRWNCDANGKPGQWLCMGIIGVSDDGGETYVVTYDFVFKNTQPTTDWRGFIVYMDRDFGCPHKDASLANGGMKYVNSYLGINFNQLKLP